MITVLAGANGFARTTKLRELKQTFAREFGQENIEQIDGEKLEKEQLPNLLQGGSLFSANRMVIIRTLSANKEVSEAFLDYLDKTSDDTKTILVEGPLDKRTAFYKTLKKQTDFIECEEPKEPELMKWVSEYAQNQQGEIGHGEARLLVEFVGLDQERLAQEIEKLVAYEPKITRQNIENLVEKRPQNTVFELLDAVLSGNKKRAQELLKNLESAFEDPYQIANLLIWQVQVLAVVKSAANTSDAEIAKDTKLSPFVISKTKRLAANIDQKTLREIVKITADMDIEIKLSKAEPWRVLEHAILSL